MILSIVLTLIAYHAGAAYFGMPWKLFFLGVIGLAWVFLMVVVARIFDSLSPPDWRGPDDGAKALGVGRAILIGEMVVNIPALGLILLTIWFAGPVIQGWIEGGASKGVGFPTLVVVMALAVGVGWMWWAIVMPRWRVWAVERVSDPRLLYGAAISAQLMWSPRGRLAFLNRTEWKTARLSHREQAALQRYLEEQAARSIPNL
ncbi:MAG TPA: hypothetical protein VFB02_22990 [Bradyrhizobium sp.]|nr:hypothetical protein [Bradyrhizobium sp.]